MAATTQQPQMGLTFEQVWAALMETRANMDRLEARVDRTTANIDRLEARADRTMAGIEQMGKRTDQTSAGIEQMLTQMGKRVDQTTINVDKMAAKVDRVSENVGGVNRSMGELIEILFAAKLWEKFKSFPYEFKMAYQRIPVYNDKKEELTDIDILLVNGDYAMVVEVKRYLKKDDVDHHLVRMERLRKYPQKLTEGKKLLGALAAGVADKDERDYAFANGFFVLELTGESVSLAPVPAAFTLREW
jgi:uncharacterized coiled-coil protein SlyX